jgi:O-antigen ligase/Tfp pilus assembly protein PilF
MWLDKLSQNITSFRQNIILGVFLFLIVVASFFSGEWNNWLAAIFLILIFPLAFYTVLIWRDRPPRHLMKLDARSPHLYLMIFLGVGLVTSFFSVMKYDSFHYWMLLAGYAMVFWVADAVFTEFSKAKIITIAIFCTGILASLINLFLFIQDPTARAGGALLNANALGSYFLFSAPLGIVLTLDAQRKKMRYLLGTGTILVLISFFLTFSYTGWVSFLVPLLVILIVYRKRAFTKKNALIFLGVIITLLVIAVGARYLSTKDFKQAIALQQTISGQSFGYSFHQRWNFIRSTASMFVDHPLAGTGLATYQQVYPRYALTVLEQPRYAHNYYLQTAAELGIIGFVGLAGFVAMLLYSAYRTVKNNFSDPTKRPYLFGLGLGLLGSAIHSLFDFGWQFPAVFLLFWISGGLLLGQSSGGGDQLSAQAGAKKPSWRTIGIVAIIIFSLVLFTRGVTLFLGQSLYERSEPKKLDGRLDEALPLYALATRFDPAPDKLRNYAEALFDQGVQKKDERQADYQQADRIFQDIARRNPNDYFAYHAAGRMYFMRKEYALAAEQYQRALQYDPVFHPDFQYDLAFLYYTQKKYDLVRETIQPVLNRYTGISRSSNPNLPTQLAYLNLLLGRNYADQGETEQARHYFQAALGYLPDFGLAKCELERVNK